MTSFDPEQIAAWGHRVRDVAGQITDRLVAEDFVVVPDATLLLLNSLATAHHAGRRIFLNAFQRCAEVLDYFGHRLHRLGMDVHLVHVQANVPPPQAGDVVITLSPTLHTEPVLVSILQADLEGLYHFVIAAPFARERESRLRGVIPLHIPGTIGEPGGDGALRAILPLGATFELRSLLYLEGIAEILARIREDVQPLDSPGGPDPVLMGTLALIRQRAQELPHIIRARTTHYHAMRRQLSVEQIGTVVRELVVAAEHGRTVYVTGFGRNNPVGGMFAQRLLNLGLRAAMTPARLEVPSKPDDLLIAITGSGATFEVLQRLSGARRAKLHTIAVTATPDSPVLQFADVFLNIPAVLEPRQGASFAERQVKPTPPALPSRSTYGLNSLLTLEAIVAVLMAALGKSEADLRHTDPWQGFEQTR